MTLIIVTTFIAAFVTGGLGYGFSSITVPIGLIKYGNRILNPAIILIELGSNIYLVISNRKSLKRVWRSTTWIAGGLVPFCIFGSILLAHLNPLATKLITYGFLAPLVILRSFGVKMNIEIKGRPGLAFGGALGLMYSLTTISGPPLAIALNNEGYTREELKAIVGTIRTVETLITFIAYCYLGFFTAESLELFLWMLPGVAIAMPLGSYVFGKMELPTFRRIFISTDSLLISFGLFRVLSAGKWLPDWAGVSICASIILLDSMNLFKYFKQRSRLNQEIGVAAEHLSRPSTSNKVA